MHVDSAMSSPPALTLQTHVQWRAEQKASDPRTYIIRAQGEASVSRVNSPTLDGTLLV